MLKGCSKMSTKEYYKYLKTQGICTGCKHRKAEKDKVRCKICLYNDHAYKKAKREISRNLKDDEILNNGKNIKINLKEIDK